jgi:hypothetical protein
VLSGKKEGHHNIQGIGEGFIPKLVNLEIINKIEMVSTQEAKNMARNIVKNEGMFVGTSSGANMVASLRIAKTIGKGKAQAQRHPIGVAVKSRKLCHRADRPRWWSQNGHRRPRKADNEEQHPNRPEYLLKHLLLPPFDSCFVFLPEGPSGLPQTFRFFHRL